MPAALHPNTAPAAPPAFGYPYAYAQMPFGYQPTFQAPKTPPAPKAPALVEVDALPTNKAAETEDEKAAQDASNGEIKGTPGQPEKLNLLPLGIGTFPNPGFQTYPANAKLPGSQSDALSEEAKAIEQVIDNAKKEEDKASAIASQEAASASESAAASEASGAESASASGEPDASSPSQQSSDVASGSESESEEEEEPPSPIGTKIKYQTTKLPNGMTTTYAYHDVKVPMAHYYAGANQKTIPITYDKIRVPVLHYKVPAPQYSIYSVRPPAQHVPVIRQDQLTDPAIPAATRVHTEGLHADGETPWARWLEGKEKSPKFPYAYYSVHGPHGVAGVAPNQFPGQ